jgi:glycosyltransferase involved in cell wall biosynthesis
MFKPTSSDLKKQYRLQDKKVVLGCASPWSTRKGYQDFIALRQLLNSSYQIAMIGLSQKEIRQLPEGITGIQRTESVEELAQWYTLADVFVNPTTQDNFPTTNLEALACGTPVITYDTGGSPESVDKQTGRIVPVKNIILLSKNIKEVTSGRREEWRQACRNRALKHYNKKNQFFKYLTLYKNLVDAKK